MNIEYISEKLDEIRRNADDDEVAHSLEDRLRDEVLQAIAKGAPDAATLSQEVLKSSELEFSRWCA